MPIDTNTAEIYNNVWKPGTDLGKMEPDGSPLPGERHQGDGTNLMRPSVRTDGSKARTAEALGKLGAGQPYGNCY